VNDRETDRAGGTDQTATEAAQRLREAEQLAEMALADEATSRQEEAPLPTPAEPEKINLLELLLKGRWLMLPIGLMSLVVVAVGAERFLGLRRGKVLPSKLIHRLEALAKRPEGFDPRLAYQLAQQYPSTASKVIQTMLLKVGRPHTELEHAINEASQREAAGLYSNVRWLNLAAAVSPLLGLFGTVWGMIQAFFQTARLPLEHYNRAQVLADGIWMALVTTFAGLAVAIPAAVLAHYFEGRTQKLFRELDEALFQILPHLERYEGRVRLTKEQLERPDARPPASPQEAASRRKPAASPK
jgi:biopolymer transport protein ExbB